MKGPSWILSDFCYSGFERFRRRTVEQELDEELRLHLEHAVERARA